MYNKDGEVIYVGKSKVLKNRVSSYFVKSKNHSPKTVAMVENVADFEYMITDTETEALVLECNLIKKYLPKYNILLKDDKHYPYIKLTLNEEFPKVFMTRKLKHDGSKYFGPYMSSAMVKNALDTIKRVFKVRSCNKRFSGNEKNTRPCLYYHIGQCSAPCCGKISKEEYKESFERISDVLEGKYDLILSELNDKMKAASNLLEFEKAARYRDKIDSIKMLGEKQKIISTNEDNRDIIGVYRFENDYCIQIFYMRCGKIEGSEHYIFLDEAVEINEIISEFIKQYYFNATNIPKEILIPANIEDLAEISDWLTKKTGYKINIHTPMRGEKRKLIDMVNKNAEESLKVYYQKRERENISQNDILAGLTELLNLPSCPHRIEMYDISNISGAESVGGCIVYNNAVPSRKDYRKFNIKTVAGADDYESTREVISRRINHAYKELELVEKKELSLERAKFLPLPDLIFLDGGRGHVNSIKMLMETLGEDIPIYGLVKDDKHMTRGICDDIKEYPIDKDSIIFKFLTQMQEEVHRFAISAFRNRHKNSAVNSELENISGIGPKNRTKLLNAFLGIDGIKKATEEELSKIVGKAAGKAVYNYFNEER